MMKNALRIALTLFATLCVSQSVASELKPGKNVLMLRGESQELYYIPGPAPAARTNPVVLFLPGDRGWAGKAIDMGRAMSAWGYDVIGLDTNRYLTSFTGRTTLTEQQIIDDIQSVSKMVAPNRRVLLSGWSAGAGLAALAGSGPARTAQYAGVVVFGLQDKNVLAWRWKDNLSILTQTEANEPTFSVSGHLASVSPVPLAILRATGDQFVSAAEAKELYEAAHEPKRYVEVKADNHRFDGNDEGFYRELKGAFDWAIHNSK